MTLARDLDAIATGTLEELRARWRRDHGPPPRLRSVGLLRQILAWRRQVEIHGGLDAETRRLLTGRTAVGETALIPGTVLTRAWKGVTHRVEVTEDGFIHDGRSWRSLSEVARAITGTRWNGPRFFGLRAPA